VIEGIVRHPRGLLTEEQFNAVATPHGAKNETRSCGARHEHGSCSAPELIVEHQAGIPVLMSPLGNHIASQSVDQA
jgi:hypothetical protein